MNLLNLVTLKSNFYEGEIPSNEIIQDLVIELNNFENPLFNLITKYQLEFNEEKTVKQRINYIELLFQLLQTELPQWNYTKEEIKLYVYYFCFLRSGNWAKNQEMFDNDILTVLEKIPTLIPSNELEIFMQEKLKYVLLNYYSIYINNNTYEKMKTLLNELKETKSQFEILEKKYNS